MGRRETEVRKKKVAALVGDESAVGTGRWFVGKLLLVVGASGVNTSKQGGGDGRARRARCDAIQDKSLYGEAGFSHENVRLSTEKSLLSKFFL